MDFETYMEIQIPGYKGLIPEESLELIKKYYDKKMEASARWERCLNLGLSTKAGIDYTTDFQKAGDDFAVYTGMLDELISIVKKDLGMVDEEAKASVK